MGNHQDSQIWELHRLYFSWELVEAPCSLRDMKQDQFPSAYPKTFPLFPRRQRTLEILVDDKWCLQRNLHPLKERALVVTHDFGKSLTHKPYWVKKKKKSYRSTRIIDIHTCTLVFLWTHTHSFSSHKTVYCSELHIPKSYQRHLELKYLGTHPVGYSIVSGPDVLRTFLEVLSIRHKLTDLFYPTSHSFPVFATSTSVFWSVNPSWLF